MRSGEVKRLVLECGFDLAGIAPAGPLLEHVWYSQWVQAGMAGRMGYLTGRRADARSDPRNLLSSARSVICAAVLYNGPQPYSTGFDESGCAWISRYAWGSDYHSVLRARLERLAGRIAEALGRGTAFEWKACVDTAPLLERSLARQAGLGWIGRNTCLIHEGAGSWFFLAELLTNLDLEPDSPPPDRCGTCTRCIDACPTQAIVPTHRAEPAWTVDARRCISYLTIELRGASPEDLRTGTGAHVFGCDICQDVCPWNRQAPVTADPAFFPRVFAPPLEALAALSQPEFAELFRGTPVSRARYAGFLRNVATAMGNATDPRFREPLERLAAHGDPAVREHAAWALKRLPAQQPMPR